MNDHAGNKGFRAIHLSAEAVLTNPDYPLSRPGEAVIVFDRAAMALYASMDGGGWEIFELGAGPTSPFSQDIGGNIRQADLSARLALKRSTSFTLANALSVQAPSDDPLAGDATMRIRADAAQTGDLERYEDSAAVALRILSMVGDETVKRDLNAGRNVNATGDVNAGGDVNCDNVSATGDVSATADVSAGNDVDAGNDVNASNDVNATADVNAGGNVAATNAVTGATVSSTAGNVHSAVDVTASRDVLATRDVTAGRNVSAVSTVSGATLSATTDVNAGRDVNATRDLTAGRNCTATLAVSGATVSSTSGNVSSAQDATATRDVTAGRDVTATRNITATLAASGATVSSTAGDVSSAQDVAATRDVTAGRNVLAPTGAGRFGISTATSYNEKFRAYRQVAGASGTLADVAQFELDVHNATGGGFADYEGAIWYVGSSGTSALDSAALEGHNMSVFHGGSGAGPDFMGGTITGAGLGDPRLSGLGAVGTAPLVAALIGQIVMGDIASGAISSAIDLYAAGPFNTSGLRTIGTQRGVYVENQGATGITDALGIDIEAVSGASGVNLSLRSKGGNAFPWVTPTTLAANTNNWQPGPVAHITAQSFRIAASGAVNLTGLIAGVDGQVVVFRNIAANVITLKHESALSTAANRFVLNGSADKALGLNDSINLQYDATSARWAQV